MRVHILLGWILNPARPRGSNRSDKITHYVTAVVERKRDKNVAHVKYWEIVADNLSKASFSWGCVSAIDSRWRTMWIADAHRD